MAIIGVKCLNHIVMEMKHNYVDFDKLSPEEVSRIINSYVTTASMSNMCTALNARNKEKK